MKVYNIRIKFNEKEFPDDDNIKNVLDTIEYILTYDTEGIKVEIKKGIKL